jgi:glycosyltransferase involved in cell wall biosynthesis
MTTRLTIVMPVFNDWESFRCLLTDLAACLSERDCTVAIVAVDDCSGERAPATLELASPIIGATVLRLSANMGHQRAIAVGLASIAARDDIDLVAVMDSDGEDRPDELVRLIDSATTHPKLAIMAQRAKRSEGLGFRLLYQIYTQAFRLLTGQRIDFGNFCLLPFEYLERLVNRPDIWNNFAATMIRARIPLARVPTTRGLRYAGESRMNFSSLVAHGLGAMSVFSEIIFIRILFGSGLLLVMVTVGAFAVLGVRMFSDLAIPGWTTNVFGFLLVIGFQTIMTAVMMAFLVLNNRASVQVAPSNVAGGYVREIQSFAGPGTNGKAVDS